MAGAEGAAMVDLFIMNYVLKGVYLGTKLILVGDSNQLPSVGPRKYFRGYNRIRANSNNYFK